MASPTRSRLCVACRSSFPDLASLPPHRHQTVNLTAAPTGTTAPDGKYVHVGDIQLPVLPTRVLRGDVCRPRTGGGHDAATASASGSHHRLGRRFRGSRWPYNGVRPPPLLTINLTNSLAFGPPGNRQQRCRRRDDRRAVGAVAFELAPGRATATPRAPAPAACRDERHLAPGSL